MSLSGSTNKLISNDITMNECKFSANNKALSFIDKLIYSILPQNDVKRLTSD